ncbi:hypothetical protein [Paenibacillus hamazuiensis]|uniref:hypothetical protein n=1 Tax=Paenibacillus hamazuiensis TaxID=2936508 RepID=UPI00200CE2D7|nr:hypothetical protein [Paenibacillus hamazuiensis]
MRVLVALMITALMLGGCRTADREDDMNAKSLQKTVTIQQLSGTLGKLPPPPMSRDIMNKSDDEIVSWIKQVDDWTHKVLSSPLTGEMDEPSMKAMRSHLMQVYSMDMADKLIGSFYNQDPQINTYQAVSTDAVLSLRSVYRDYDLKKSQPSPDQYRIDLVGSTKNDRQEVRVEHNSAYQVQGDRLVITEFRTS